MSLKGRVALMARARAAAECRVVPMAMAMAAAVLAGNGWTCVLDVFQLFRGWQIQRVKKVKEGGRKEGAEGTSFASRPGSNIELHSNNSTTHHNSPASLTTTTYCFTPRASPVRSADHHHHHSQERPTGVQECIKQHRTGQDRTGRTKIGPDGGATECHEARRRRRALCTVQAGAAGYVEL